MGENEGKTIIEQALKGGALFCVVCLLLVGIYAIITPLMPNVRLTDAQYLEATSKAFEKLSENALRQTDLLTEIRTSNAAILKEHEHTHANVLELLKVNPGQVREEVLKNREYLKRIEAATDKEVSIN